MTERASSRVRFFFIAGASNETCGISKRCSAINQTGLSVVIQFKRSKRARFPVNVTVVAWQWGRGAEPRVKTAAPVERTFAIEAAAKDSK